MVSIKEAIQLVEKKSGYKVVKIFDFKHEYYLCIIKDPQSGFMFDPFYTVNKNTKSTCVFIPTSDPKAFKEAITKHEIDISKPK